MTGEGEDARSAVIASEAIQDHPMTLDRFVALLLAMTERHESVSSRCRRTRALIAVPPSSHERAQGRPGIR
ncbi:hypothetical protein ACVIJ6_005829 [Bradyrhizobium sp. USDA 4369]